MAQVPAGKNRSGQLSKQTGDAWENQARRWLEGQGLRFIAANARERGGEIDLIMRDGTVTDTAQYSLTGEQWPAVERHLTHLLAHRA